MLSKFFLIFALGTFCSERGEVELQLKLRSDGKLVTKMDCSDPDLRIPVYKKEG